MPVLESTKRTLRKARSNYKINRLFKDEIALLVKKYKTKPTNTLFGELTSKLDKAVKNGVYHKNKVDRLKSQFSKMISGETKVESKEKVTTKKSKKSKMA